MFQSLDSLKKMITDPSEEVVSLETKIHQDGLEERTRAYLTDKLVFVKTLTSATDHIALSPVQQLAVRNMIVEILDLRAVTYIGLIRRLYTRAKTVPLALGHSVETIAQMKDFRFWLDVMIKMTNAPNRIQNSTWLEVPSKHPVSTRTKARLVYTHTGVLDRMFYNDKVGKMGAMPTLVPLGSYLSFFMAAYLLYCTPPGSDYVFDTNKTTHWSIKSTVYLEQLQSPHHVTDIPSWLFKTQHGLRSTAIGALCALHRFDTDKLLEIAHISRHTINVLLTDYAYWSKLHKKRYEANDEKKLYYFVPSMTTIPSDLLKKVYVEMDHVYLPPRPFENIDNHVILEATEENYDDEKVQEDEYLFYKGALPLCKICKVRVLVRHFDKNAIYLECPLVPNHPAYTRNILPRQLTTLYDTIHDLNGVNLALHPRGSLGPSGRNKKEVDSAKKRMSRTRVSERVYESVYIGIDMSQNCTAVCLLHPVINNGEHSMEKTIHYFEPVSTVQDKFKTRNRRDYTRYVYDGPKELHRSVVALIQKEVKDNDYCHITYESDLGVDRYHTAKHREFSISMIQYIRSHVDHVGTKVWFHNLMDKYVKVAWQKTFHFEKPLGAFERTYCTHIQQFIDKNRQRRRGHEPNLHARQAQKLLNYVVWAGKGLGVLGDTCSTLNMDNMKNNRECFSDHPFSDIVDSYILARYLFYLDCYSRGTLQHNGRGEADEGDSNSDLEEEVD
jgi:hypothetical protein